jgi:hypothetical protein
MTELRDHIASLVLADASDKLVRALDRHDFYKAERAIEVVVRAALPDRITMPERVIDTIYRGTPGPHIAWKWISATGVKVLLVHASIHDWGTIEVSAFLTYPGLSKREQLLYRDTTKDIATLPLLVQQAVKQMEAPYL